MNRHLAELEEHGYTILPELLPVDECQRYKDLLEADYSRFAPRYANANTTAGTLSDKTGEKVVFNMHNKDIAWFRLFEQPKVLSLLDVVLREGTYHNDEPYYLNNISARCPLKGHPGQQLHLDSNLPGVNYALIVNVLWMLDDFTLDNGATRVVPGSHKLRSFAPDGQLHPDERLITGKRGTALVFNANLWHGGGQNCSGASRWGVALGYARWFIKPSFDFMRNTPGDVFATLTNTQKDLLGFRLVPPKDEFTRLRRRSDTAEMPFEYKLP